MRSFRIGFPCRPFAKQQQPLRSLIRANSTGSYTPIISPQVEEVKVRVPVGLKGHIWLHIRHPPKPSPECPIILYLRRGFATVAPLEDITPLALGSSATVVRLEYRERYPVSIHDVLHGYDWVQKHLARGTATSHGLYENVMSAKLGVCGELIGGSLASMLSLTECHTNKPSISAVAMGNPIVDWTSFFPATDDTTSHSPTVTRRFPTTLTDCLTTESLLIQRAKLFSHPEQFFDPFASPLLFFRTPSYDIPPNPAAYPGLGINASANNEYLDNLSTPPVKKRRSHRKYPPPSSDLRLPRMRIEIGKDNVLKAQGLELAELARRSVGMWEAGGKDGLWGTYGAWADEEFTRIEGESGKKRIEVVEREGLGLWGKREMGEVGSWFGEVLRRR